MATGSRDRPGFTRLALGAGAAYLVTGVPDVGAFAFNCMLATAVSFEGCRIVDPATFSALESEFCRRNRCSRLHFALADASVHVLPVAAMLCARSHWAATSAPLWQHACASLTFHIGWAKVMCNDYDLSSVYPVGDGVNVPRSTWRRLWLLAGAGHVCTALLLVVS